MSRLLACFCATLLVLTLAGCIPYHPGPGQRPYVFSPVP